MISREKKSKIVLLAGVIYYLIGCTSYYFLWYKNSQFFHVIIIVLVVAGVSVFIGQYKLNGLILKKVRSYKTVIVIFFILLFVGGAGLVVSSEKKRVKSILDNEPTKQVIATVVAVDLRSTRSGKQPWSIINYSAKDQLIEQSFADTGKDLAPGRKYVIEYSLEHPDMFRILKKLK